MELQLDYVSIKSLFITLGGDKFLNVFQCFHPKFSLYNFSTDWLESKDCILKFRGTYEDVIVNWN